jgi:hypothetical protein
MADIFLSYANEDREIARAVAGLLESAGCTVWWDRRIPAGRTWRSMIEEALRDMRCMVVLWSSHSVDSDWVKEEAEEARALNRLIPVLIEVVKPPVGFRSIQAADLTDWDGSRDSLGARQLIADLESLMARSAPSKFTKVDESLAKSQPIPGSNAEDARAVDPAEINDQSPNFTASAPGHEGGASAAKSGRGLALGWKTAVAAVLIIGTVLGALLWIGKQDRTTSEPEVAAVKPAPAPRPALVRLDLSGDRQEVATKETANVTLKGQYTDGTQKIISEGVQWLSSETRVATIDDQGRVTARLAGETKITARYGDLVSSAWTLAVRPEKPVLPVTVPTENPVVKAPVTTKPVTLTVSAIKREVRIQERLPLRVKARYSDGKEKGLSSGVEWRTSDASVAVVDARGELVALRPGKILVVARWGEIESLGFDIVVRESPVRYWPSGAPNLPRGELNPAGPHLPRGE